VTRVDLMPLVNAGVAGVVLAWVLWRTDRRLERIERALDRVARAQLLALVVRPDVPEHVRAQANACLQEANE